MTEAHNTDLNCYDEHIKIADWLQATEMPSALVLTETLESVGGRKDIIFPPTYARTGGDHPYSIDELKFGKTTSALPDGDHNTCLIDSVGSQANRMENCFAKKQEQPNSLSELVPQIVVEADGQSINVLEAGHRIADAAVRFSALEEEARAAIKTMADKGDALALAQLAPTSLVFGFWDSRDTGYKSGRLLSSTIRASNVAVVSRSGQYVPSYDTKALGLTAESFKAEASDEEQQEDLSDTVWAKLGLVSVPVPATKSKPVIRVENKVVGMHGGVHVFGDIVRRTQLSLVGLRSLVALADDGQVDAEKTMKLRRYILGLALIAARCQTDYKLREGCNLVGSLEKPLQAEIVYADGKREPFDWNTAQAFAFARQAAQDFGVQTRTPRNVPFSVEKVRAAVKKEESKKPKKTAGSKK